jgi:hypothetical protein
MQQESDRGQFWVLRESQRAAKERELLKLRAPLHKIHTTESKHPGNKVRYGIKAKLELALQEHRNLRRYLREA